MRPHATKPQVFYFDGYVFDETQKTLSFAYSYDTGEAFTEVYSFDFPFADFDKDALDRACLLAHLMAGVSYYKAFLPSRIELRGVSLDTKTADFLSRTYQHGLGEFFYINQLDPDTEIRFEPNGDELNPVKNHGRGAMIGLGGGKDSLVSVELMRNDTPRTWSVGHHTQLEPLVERISLAHLWVERQWDRKLLDLNQNGAYNGHVPISAILACIGAVVAILSGKRDIVVSNEQSANEPTLEYRGRSINHQYSKSSAFEMDFQNLLEHHFGDSVRYFSLLRPYSELRICELFSRGAFARYKDVFSSCNRAYTHGNTRMSWCGECPKCAFVFLALTPFIARDELEALFGKNLLLDDTLMPVYRQLLGIEGDKPLECVGEVRESRAAMRQAFMHYPELTSSYVFELPDSYDWRAVSDSHIPLDMQHFLPKNEN